MLSCLTVMEASASRWRGRDRQAVLGGLLPQGLVLALEGVYPLGELLYPVVGAVELLVLLQLALQPLDVLLGPRPDGALGLTVVGSLARELGGCQGGNTARSWKWHKR